MADDDSVSSPKPGADPDPAAPDRPRTFTFRRSFTIGRPPPTDPDAVIIQGPERRFEWRFGADPAATADDRPIDQPADAEVHEPVTYYEAFTGKRDPNRDFFINARRALDGLLWAIVVGLPLVLVAFGILAGERLETIVLMGVFGLIIGLMIRSSLPRTRFG